METVAATMPLPLGEDNRELTFDVDNPSDVRFFCDVASSFNVDMLYGRGLISNLTWEIARTSLKPYTCELLGPDLEPVATVSFSYLVITPFTHPNAVVDQRAYWVTKTATPLIGHRGAGAHKAAYVASEAKHRTHVQENTLLSFATAASLGAEYVEFDVQLTKDLVPVIYHNFIVDETNYHVPVNRLTLAEFQVDCVVRRRKKEKMKMKKKKEVSEKERGGGGKKKRERERERERERKKKKTFCTPRSRVFLM